MKKKINLEISLEEFSVIFYALENYNSSYIYSEEKAYNRIWKKVYKIMYEE